jgi:hypothetical protein
MHEPLIPMLFHVLGAHISCAEFQYPDLNWKEMCGLMANPVGNSGCNKGRLTEFARASHSDSETRNVKVSRLKHLSKKDIKSIGKSVRTLNQMKD